MILLQKLVNLWNCIISFNQQSEHDNEESLLQKCTHPMEPMDISYDNNKSTYEPPFIINELI